MIDNGDGLKKESVVLISESKDHNRIAALACLKKVTEEVERVNAVKYTKVVVWSMAALPSSDPVLSSIF